ncbi:MAG: hypothetical protein PHS38_14645 [Bacteroidales bacterium]|nr:hypothetical protein [Bacteroidales bacterium]
MKEVNRLIEFIISLDGTGNKDAVKQQVVQQFKLVRDRSVFYCDSFAIRFSYTSGNSFSNTVLSLSALQKYDSIPFIVCIVTPNINRLLLANTTFLSKISHSSQELTLYNIKGSFNGSDIMKEYQDIPNERDNIIELYPFHEEFSFQENLIRLVEATNNISPTGKRFSANDENIKTIIDSVDRANNFNNSPDYVVLKGELDARVKKYSKEIMVASHIENVNIRGRLIEYLITEDDDDLKARLVEEINEEYSQLPKFTTQNLLGDYKRIFNDYNTETDVKTKVIILNSNPKAYNIDKFLEFLSQDKSVFLFFFVGINDVAVTNTCLVSVFQKDLLCGTVYLRHWAGRNSRGVTQFMGKVIDKLLAKQGQDIDIEKAKAFLAELIEL